MTFGGVLSSANQNANIFVVTNGKAVNGFCSSRSVKLECVHGVFKAIQGKTKLKENKPHPIPFLNIPKLYI